VGKKNRTDYTGLLPLAGCLLTTPSTLSASALASYNAYGCLQANDKTNGVPKECQSSSSLFAFLSCTQSTETVVQNIVGNTTSAACPQVLIGPLTQYCSVEFGTAVQDFCKPTFCQQPFPGSTTLDMCSGIGVVAGVLGGLLFLGCVGFLVYRYRLKKMQDSAFSSPPSPGMGAYSGGSFSPGISFSSGSQPQMAKAGSFSSLVPPPPGVMSPGYYPSVASPMYSAPPMAPQASSPIPASKALDPSTLTIRKGQLCDFYLFHDPTRENIPEHVDKLFDKYSFENILAAVRSKYGVAPPGWQA